MRSNTLYRTLNCLGLLKVFKPNNILYDILRTSDCFWRLIKNIYKDTKFSTLVEQCHHLLTDKGAKPKPRTMAGGGEGEEWEARKKVKKKSVFKQ